MPLRWKSEQSEKALTTRDVNKENTRRKKRKKEVEFSYRPQDRTYTSKYISS